jgi:hypothetical protein
MARDATVGLIFILACGLSKARPRHFFRDPGEYYPGDCLLRFRLATHGA